MENMPPPPLVKTKNLCKDFPSGDDVIHVLKDINLEIYPGEMTMLVGPSGCGKTTLLSIITGILSATRGETYIENICLNKLSDLEKVLLRRKYIGFIFQQYNLLPSLTGAENAAIPLIASGIPFTEAVNKSKNTLKKIGLEGHTSKLPAQLSGGMQQRVAIARAIVHNPRFIVCDEPTSALDAHTGHIIMKILRKIALEENRVVLVVTHDSRILEFADRILYMGDGIIEKDERS